MPAVRPPGRTPAIDALDAAAANILGDSQHTWVSRTGARHYLPDLVAKALHRATGAQASLVPASQHTTQGALDGAVAALHRGPVTKLDLTRLFGYPDDRPTIVALRPGEFRAAIAAHDAMSNPCSRDGDNAWWNWCRMPAGVSTAVDDPATVAVMPFVVPRLSELLGRDLDSERTQAHARNSLLNALL